uniref:Uncharacterized protein n=1 Tax=Kalanchoe fedtschenkoi TaxID=63787 RepID=A0A7N0UR02_KALFE
MLDNLNSANPKYICSLTVLPDGYLQLAQNAPWKQVRFCFFRFGHPSKQESVRMKDQQLVRGLQALMERTKSNSLIRFETRLHFQRRFSSPQLLKGQAMFSESISILKRPHH